MQYICYIKKTLTSRIERKFKIEERGKILKRDIQNEER